MSRKDQLMHQLGDEIRAGQRATDAVDEAVSKVTGTNRTDGKVLDILDQHGRMSAGELARQSGLTTGAVTAVIDRLEQIGFAHRVADPADRRRVLVELTPHGVETIAELMGPLAEQGRSLLSGYSDEQLELLLEFTRAGREMQERHAERLRARVAKAP
jgi:DNA-binding MarR family transcriptional regulator